MAKKQAQFRFEEEFYAGVLRLAEEEGITISEVVRNALTLYALIYDRTKDKGIRLFMESEDGQQPKCEVVLPWIHSKLI